MKKSLAFLVVLVVTIACGPKKEKKKSFEYKRTTTEKKAEKKAIEKASRGMQRSLSFDKVQSLMLIHRKI